MSDKALGCEATSKINDKLTFWTFLYSPFCVQCTDCYSFVQLLGAALHCLCSKTVNSLFGSKRTKNPVQILMEDLEKD